jgi:hypothetical protein
VNVPLLVLHDTDCPNTGAGHSDAAKRVSDTWRLHRSAIGLDAAGKWFAASLADGSSDGVLYDCKRDAVRHQHHNERWYAFLRIGPADCSPCEGEVFLEINRMLWSKNIRMTDPDDLSGGPDVIRRTAREDDRSLMRSIASGGRTRPSNLIYPRGGVS